VGARSSAWCPSRTSERSCSAEGEDERGAATLAVAEIERSPVRLHDPPREEQADPEPLVGAVARPLDLREQLEDPVALIGRDPGTPVGDLEAQLLVGALTARSSTAASCRKSRAFSVTSTTARDASSWCAMTSEIRSSSGIRRSMIPSSVAPNSPSASSTIDESGTACVVIAASRSSETTAPMFATSRRSLLAARSTPSARSRISSPVSRPSETASVAAVPWIVVIGVNSSCARICTSSVFIRLSSASSVLSSSARASERPSSCMTWPVTSGDRLLSPRTLPRTAAMISSGADPLTR
jgi:hypothetical protein